MTDRQTREVNIRVAKAERSRTNSTIYIIKGDMSVYLCVCMLPMAGRMAGPIKTKLGIGTHVDPRSVFVKVIYLCVTVCGIKFMPATPGEQQ